MHRNQFIFLSHTGLLPQCRTLGPSALVWQVTFFVVCLNVLGFWPSAAVSAAIDTHAQPVMGDPVVRVLSSSISQTRIQVQFPVERQPSDWETVVVESVKWAIPESYDEDEDGNITISPPKISILLAVPGRSVPVVTVSGTNWWKEPISPVSASDLVSFSKPVIFQTVPMAGSALPVAIDQGILRSLIVEIQHQPSAHYSQQLQAASQVDPSDKNAAALDRAPSGLLNKDLFVTLSRGGRILLSSKSKSALDRGQFNHFDLTDNWVRLTVDESGLHQLTGQQLSGMGVSTSSVDPGKLRLYRGGSFQLESDPEIPEADQSHRVGLTEIPIQLLDGSDGEWNLDDEIRFHAFGTDFWSDRVDTDAGQLEFYNHPYENEGIYWLTWENISTASPIPDSPLRVSEIDTPPNGGDSLVTAKFRLHMEQQNKDAQGVLLDNWSWDNSVLFTKTLPFTIFEPVPGSQSTFEVEFRGRPFGLTGENYDFMARSWVNNDSDHNGYITFEGRSQVNNPKITVTGESTEMVTGTNVLSFQNANEERDFALVLDSFDIFYWTALDLVAQGGQMDFALWGEHTVADGQLVDLSLTVPTSVEVLLWEVQGLQGVSVLTGQMNQSQLTCGLTLDTTNNRHFLATTEAQLHQVSSGQVAHPVDLRSLPTDANYIVVYADAFAGPAENLAEFHSSNLPRFSSPKAYAISANDIYDNFSGGQKDIYAIRNYLKTIYEDGGGELRYVCMLGNCSRDHRNYKNQDMNSDLVDLLPALHRNFFPINPGVNYRYPYGTDDAFVSFETPPSSIVPDYPDIAIGRLPAVSNIEATKLVDRAIEYTTTVVPGSWSNSFLMVTDDCVVPPPKNTRWPEPYGAEYRHTVQAEFLCQNSIPQSIDMLKIFGATYPFPPGSRIKPQIRMDINTALNSGTTIFHYIGHGAENNLSDEQIFQSQDISNLTNHMKRFAFIAFSCDVGVYDSPSRRSMAELFVLAENGGAIAAICASEVSWVSSNNLLSTAFYNNLYAGRHVDSENTISEALLQGKSEMLGSGPINNSQRYNLLCDPALRLPNPPDDLTFASANLDTLRTGARQVVVLDEAGGVMLGAGDTYKLLVEESAYIAGYVSQMTDSTSVDDPQVVIRIPVWRTYEQRASAIFNGSGTMNSSELRVPFKVPVQLRYGDLARLRLILSGLGGTHVAFESVSAVRSATAPSEDIVGPLINLAFEDNRTRVRAGDQMTAVLQDSSSIAILGTTPGNSLLLEFDNTGFMTDVTHGFNFDPNSYTSGNLSFPLPGDLAMGNHQAALHASDALGNVGNDTISFLIVPESVVGMESITLFPNPTHGPCRLIFELSDPMLVKWEIYTLSGHRIKSMAEQLSAGPQIIPWDGRDDQGDEIANGTYLYVLRGNVTGGGERDITETGKLVIMR